MKINHQNVISKLTNFFLKAQQSSIQLQVPIHNNVLSNNTNLVSSSADIMKVFKQGKMASMIGIEGGHSIGNSMGSLRMMYELGVRYLTLTHTCNTLWSVQSNH